MRLLTCRSICAATDSTIIVLLGAVAIRTVLPSIFTSLTRIANSSDPLKLALNEISYKPFISLFNVTGASQANPSIAGIVDYASAVAIELRATPGGGEPTVNMRFKNGTTDSKFHDLELFGKSHVGLSEFIGRLSVSMLSSVMNEDVS